MEEIEISSLLSRELFDRFCEQLRKDFEGAGLSGQFTRSLKPEPRQIIQSLLQEIPFDKPSVLSALLYRIDISEHQIRQYMGRSPDQNFEWVLAELVIKRILQKVVLKKKFSSDGKERLD